MDHLADWATIILASATLLNVILSGAATIIGAWNKRDIKKIEIATNSMKDALVKATGEAAHAAGLIQGVQEEKDRNKS